MQKCAQNPSELSPWNELERLAGADADYRADIEAGVTLGPVSHLLLARCGGGLPPL
jgi:hypothetical protein